MKWDSGIRDLSASWLDSLPDLIVWAVINCHAISIYPGIGTLTSPSVINQCKTPHGFVWNNENAVSAYMNCESAYHDNYTTT